MTTYRCGHPKTPENSWSYGTINGVKRLRCKACQQQRKNQTYTRSAADRVRFRHPSPAPIEVTPAMALYRAEKAKRPGRLNGTQKYLDRFNCGHPRTPENSTAKIRPQCRQCMKVKYHAKQRFRCGHPTTPENTVVLQGAVRTHHRCKTCRTAGVRQPRPHRPRTIQLVDPLRFAPRPLPVRDDSGRSYEAFPLKPYVGRTA